MVAVRRELNPLHSSPDCSDQARLLLGSLAATMFIRIPLLWKEIKEVRE